MVYCALPGSISEPGPLLNHRPSRGSILKQVMRGWGLVQKQDSGPAGSVFIFHRLVMFEKLQQRADQLKIEIFALYLAARHPRTPWYAKLFVAAIVAYALSPIDLIPDFVPVLGYLDDLFLIPLGITLAIKMIPQPVLAECRARVPEIFQKGTPVSRVAGTVIILLWLLLAALCAAWIYETFQVNSCSGLAFHGIVGGLIMKIREGSPSAPSTTSWHPIKRINP